MAARKIPGEFVPLDVHFQRDLGALSVPAELLFLRTLAYARLHKTDGNLTRRDLDSAGAKLRGCMNVADELVRECFWVVTPDGWHVRSWEKWNGTKEQATAEKLAQQEAARLTNHKRYHVAKDEFDGRCEHCLRDATDVATEVASEIASVSQKEKESKKEKEKEREKESVPTDAVERRSAGGADAPTQTLIAEWIEHCTDRPPSRVIGQVAKEIHSLLDDGQPYADVRRGFAAWAQKGLHPATLASVVHETRTVGTRRNATTNDRVAAALSLAADLAEREQAGELHQIGAAS